LFCLEEVGGRPTRSGLVSDGSSLKEADRVRAAGTNRLGKLTRLVFHIAARQTGIQLFVATQPRAVCAFDWCGREIPWHEMLRVTPNAAANTVRLATRRLALRYCPDRGGTLPQMTRISAAYARANTPVVNRRPASRGRAHLPALD
jgi:hypothetical protein